jgi:hypothetical protein
MAFFRAEVVQCSFLLFSKTSFFELGSVIRRKIFKHRPTAKTKPLRAAKPFVARPLKKWLNNIWREIADGKDRVISVKKDLLQVLPTNQ